jgi:ketosteroid isomerase-like protein
MIAKLILISCTCLVACGLAGAQTPPKPAEDPAHEELRVLRTQIIEAITKGDIDRVIASVHPNVVITWQNNDVCRGHQGLRDFFNRLGKDAFKGYRTPPTPDELTILYGNDTGISFGETVADYHLLGTSHQMKSRWTATLVKENGRWLLAGYHISMNVLDNPILNAAKRGLVWAASIAAIVALVAGLVFGRMLGRKPSAAA